MIDPSRFRSRHSPALYAWATELRQAGNTDKAQQLMRAVAALEGCHAAARTLRLFSAPGEELPCETLAEILEEVESDTFCLE